MQSSPIVVRAPANESEIEDYFRLAVRTFWPNEEDKYESRVRWWHRFATDAPDYEPDQIRCAFRGSTVVGGCVVLSRKLRIPPVELETSCIALVATDVTLRYQGIARALLLDVVERAQRLRHALLLLGGIPNFYHQFGFADIFDSSEHMIKRDVVLGLPPSDVSVRPATHADAPALLALHNRHHTHYSGSFARTLEAQQYLLNVRTSPNPTYLAVTPQDEPCGYMFLSSATQPEVAIEVVADSWAAASALLQFQAHLLDDHSPPPQELTWVAPPTSQTLYHLLDNLRLPRTTPQPPFPNWFVVRSLTRHMQIAGWMARPAHLPTLIEGLMPRWNQRAERYVKHMPSSLDLRIGAEAFRLDRDGDGVRLGTPDTPAAQIVALTPDVFTQLLFGFRSVEWATERPDQHIPPDVVPLLEALFSPNHTWIASSDAF